MSRAKGRTGVWRAAALLAGALLQLSSGQAFAQRPGITSAPVGARPSYEARSEQKTQAVSMLAQARTHYAQGNFDTAEQLAMEAAKLKVSWSVNEDSPTKLLGEIRNARNEPKMLLLAARAALGRKEYQRAERFAKLADRHAGMMSFPPWGDTPSKVLSDIRSAQSSGVVSSSAATATKSSAPWSKKPEESKNAVVQTGYSSKPTTPTTTSTATSPAVAPNKTITKAPSTPVPAQAKAGDETDEARQVLKQAREALARKDYERAHALVAVSRQMKHNLGWWDDHPDKVESDIRRAEMGGRPALPTANNSRPGAPAHATVQNKTTTPVTPTQPTSIPRTKNEARHQLAVGRKLLEEGKLDEAAQTAQRIKAQSNISWGLFEDSPDRLAIDVEKARTVRDRQEAARLLAEGRKLYEQGQYEEATKLAYRAQKLHGSYSIWDLGDRPAKLLSDIQTAQAKSRRTALPPSAVVKNTSSETGATSAPVVQTANNTPASSSVVPSPDRLKAQQLVAEAQRLLMENKLLEARQKTLEAQKLNVRFGPDENSPEFVYQQLATQARQKIAALSSSAQEAVAQGKADVAKARLEEARQLAASFGQDTRPIEAQLVAVGGMKSPGTGATFPAAPTSVAQGTSPGVHLGTGPALPEVNSSTSPAGTAAAQPTPQGLRLLEDARVELRKGETANARRLAEAALTGKHNVQNDAMALLRTIDAEEANQKQLAANRAFDAALAAYRRREYQRASAMIAALDTRLLDAERQGRLREIAMTPEMSPVARQTEKSPTGSTTQGSIRTVGDVVPAGGTSPSTLPSDGFGPGRAVVSDAADGGLLDRHKQMQRVLFEKLRQDGLEAQREAAEKFRAGQTDQALEILQDYLARVQDEKLETSQLSLLKRPIESRLSHYRLLKAQKDMAAGAVASRQANADKIRDRYKAEEMKQKNIEKLMKEFNREFAAAHYLEAENLAMRALELDPDNGVASAAVYMARRQRDVASYQKIKEGRERYNLAALNDAEKEPGYRAIENGVDYDEEVWNRAKKRKAVDPIQIGKPSEKEKLIEKQLSTPISVSFDSQPLRVVLDELQNMHGVNIVPDMPALQEAGVSLESQISIKLDRISLRSALNLILHQVRLTHTIRDEVLMITTEENAKGKVKPVSYNVADLVIPVENFGDIRNGSVIPNAPGTASQQVAMGPGAMPYTGPFAMANGQNVGTPSGGSMLNGGGGGPTSSSNGVNVAKRVSTTTEDQLIKLITSTIQPRSWSEMGGPGTIEYFPMTMSLVINQTPDIQEQIQDLLSSLRRLQDQEVSVEVRFISVSEDFFERVGVNFNMNVLTNNARYEPALQTSAFTFDSSQFINAFRPGRFLAGMTPAGTLTPTLDIPINQNSFLQTVPTFGSYAPGGLTMGLAFLSDIQVFLFLEAAQGNQRANIMQAPKLTLFNGQTSTLNVNDFQSFVSGVFITQVQGTGQFAIVPQTIQFPLGVFLTIQAVISADRRFVRLTLAPFLTNLAPGPINTFPIVVPIFTSIEGNQAGQPVLLTQLVQQPIITSVSVQTTVAVPDGGTVLMGGLKRLSEARSEFGPPILSKVPYVNRLFKNVGYGRETDSLLIMVTPRIIVQAEEEERQTGFSSAEAGGAAGS